MGHRDHRGHEKEQFRPLSVISVTSVAKHFCSDNRRLYGTRCGKFISSMGGTLMVMIGRFSSDDPSWREPWDREPDRARNDADWDGLNPQARGRTARRTRTRRALPTPPTPERPNPNRDIDASHS